MIFSRIEIQEYFKLENEYFYGTALENAQSELT